MVPVLWKGRLFGNQIKVQFVEQIEHQIIFRHQVVVLTIYAAFTRRNRSSHLTKQPMSGLVTAKNLNPVTTVFCQKHLIKLS